MDKYEYKIRANEIKLLIEQEQYAQAAEIADTIDWRRVKSVMMLCMISDLYKINRRYEDARDLLLLAYERRPGGRTICYSLCELSIKMEEYVQAIEYYKEYVQAAGSTKDVGRYILQYKLYEAQDVSLEERIAVLERLKQCEYREKWGYELAYLYHRIGLASRCVEECDELIVWFGEGKYVIKAMELKMLHQPLTPAQQKKYDQRFDSLEMYQPVPEEPSQEEAVPENVEAVNEQIAYNEPVAYNEPYMEPTQPEPVQYVTGDTQIYERVQIPFVAPTESVVPTAPTVPEVEEVPVEQPEEMDIYVKTMDVGQYNTMNLQAELAAGLREVLEAEQPKPAIEDPITRSIMAPMLESDTESLDGLAIEDVEEDDLEAESAVAEIASSEVFFGETGEISVMEAEQAALKELNLSAEAVANEAEQEGFATEEGQQETVVPDVTAEIVMEQLRQENTVSAPAPEIAVQLLEEPPKAIAHILSQEADGQIRLIMPEKELLEKQITGQINIEDILAEWERIKKENQEKREEEIRMHVLQQTGPMFTEFEASVRDGLLEQLERDNGIEKDVTEVESADNAEDEIDTEETYAEETNADEAYMGEEVITEADEVEELEELEAPEEEYFAGDAETYEGAEVFEEEYVVEDAEIYEEPEAPEEEYVVEEDTEIYEEPEVPEEEYVVEEDTEIYEEPEVPEEEYVAEEDTEIYEEPEVPEEEYVVEEDAEIYEEPEVPEEEYVAEEDTEICEEPEAPEEEYVVEEDAEICEEPEAPEEEYVVEEDAESCEEPGVPEEEYVVEEDAEIYEDTEVPEEEFVIEEVASLEKEAFAEDLVVEEFNFVEDTEAPKEEAVGESEKDFTVEEFSFEEEPEVEEVSVVEATEVPEEMYEEEQAKPEISVGEMAVAGLSMVAGTQMIENALTAEDGERLEAETYEPSEEAEELVAPEESMEDAVEEVSEIEELASSKGSEVAEVESSKEEPEESEPSEEVEEPEAAVDTEAPVEEVETEEFFFEEEAEAEEIEETTIPDESVEVEEFTVAEEVAEDVAVEVTEIEELAFSKESEVAEVESSKEEAEEPELSEESEEVEEPEASVEPEAPAEEVEVEEFFFEEEAEAEEIEETTILEEAAEVEEFTVPEEVAEVEQPVAPEEPTEKAVEEAEEPELSEESEEVEETEASVESETPAEEVEVEEFFFEEEAEEPAKVEEPVALEEPAEEPVEEVAEIEESPEIEAEPEKSVEEAPENEEVTENEAGPELEKPENEEPELSEESEELKESEEMESSENTEAPTEDLVIVEEPIEEVSEEEDEALQATLILEEPEILEEEPVAIKVPSTVEQDKARVRSLTPEERELYGDFIQSRTSEEKLVKAIDNISLAAYTGNIIITGDEGVDTLPLAKNMIREMQVEDRNFSGVVAKTSGSMLNKKDVVDMLKQLRNGALIVTGASEMNTETVNTLYKSLQHEREGIVVVLLDTKRAIEKFLEKNPQLRTCFTARMDVEAPSNDKLVAFGKQYAEEKEYGIDELGVLALHTKIESMQTIDHAVTTEDVKEIIDEAIDRVNKKTLGHFFDVLFAKRYDEEDRIVLSEKDFV